MKKIYLTIWIATTILLLYIIPVSADDMNIVGEMKDNLNLSIDNEYIFNRDNIVPGQEWSANIIFQNSSKEDMSVSLIEINQNNDHVSNCLNLTVFEGDKVLYDGGYISKNTPYFNIDVSAMERKHIIVKVKVNAKADNSLQDEGLHSVWYFEAKTVKDIKPTAVPTANSRINSHVRNSRSGYSGGIIARPSSSNNSIIQKYEGYNLAQKSIMNEQEDAENNFSAEISEKNENTENISENADLKGAADKLDTEKNENSSENELHAQEKKKSKSKQKNKPVKTGNEHMDDTTTDITNILLMFLSFIIITYIIVSWRERRRNKND